MKLTASIPVLIAGAARTVPSDSRPGLELRGKPWPDCKTFTITETGLVFPVASSPERPPWQRNDPLFSLEFGGMRNIGSHFALGGALAVTIDGDDELRRAVAIKPRVRYWITRYVSVDVAPGLVVGINSSPTDDLPSFMGHVGVSLYDWVILVAQLDKNEYRSNFYLGVKLGAHAGMATGIAAATLGALAHVVTYAMD